MINSIENDLNHSDINAIYFQIVFTFAKRKSIENLSVFPIKTNPKGNKMSDNCSNNNKPRTFSELIRSSYFLKPFLSFVGGGILGYLYYIFVGCESGSCGITSHPVSSALMGAAIVYFLVNKPCSSC